MTDALALLPFDQPTFDRIGLRIEGVSAGFVGSPNVGDWGGVLQGFIGLYDRNEGQNRRILPWIIGDLINYGQDKFGEQYSAYLPDSGYATESLRQFAWAAANVKPEDRPLKEFSAWVVAIKLYREAPNAAKAILANAAENGHSRRQISQQVKATADALMIDLDPPSQRLDELRMITGVHRPLCPTCSCMGLADDGRIDDTARLKSFITLANIVRTALDQNLFGQDDIVRLAAEDALERLDLDKREGSHGKKTRKVGTR